MRDYVSYSKWLLVGWRLACWLHGAPDWINDSTLVGLCSILGPEGPNFPIPALTQPANADKLALLPSTLGSRRVALGKLCAPVRR